MSTQTLSSVATNVIGQYSQVGKIVVGAYRKGAQRLIGGANTRYAAFLNERSLPLVTEAVKSSLVDVQKQIVGYIEDGIETGTNRAESAITMLSNRVNGGIERLAETAGRLENAFDTTAIKTVSGLAMPVAHVSLEIANRAVEGTKRLSARVVGAEEVLPGKAAQRPAVKKVVRRNKSRA